MIDSEFNVGDLVLWHEPYADGLLIKDVGQGIILTKQHYNFGFKSGCYVNYKVYRTKYSDTMNFEVAELKKLKKVIKEY